MCLSFWDFGWKVFGLSINGFRQFSKLQFICPQISFVGKKFFFISTGFWAKIFYLFSIKVREGFQNCILRVQGKILRKIIFFFENKKFYLIFFWFFFPKLNGKPVKTAFYVSRGSFPREKGCLKHQKIVYFLGDLKRIIFGYSAKLFR